MCEIYIPCPSNCTDEKHGSCRIDGNCLCNDEFEGESCEYAKGTML